RRVEGTSAQMRDCVFRIFAPLMLRFNPGYRPRQMPADRLAKTPPCEVPPVGWQPAHSKQSFNGLKKSRQFWERTMLVYTPPKTATGIPIIDLGSANSSKTIAWEIHKACRDTGFFYLMNHGVPMEMLTQQLDWARKFFALPLEKKLEIDMQRANRSCGYDPMQRQTLDPGSPPDLKEGFQFQRELPQEHSQCDTSSNTSMCPANFPGFREQMLAYQGMTINLGKRLMRYVALSVELSEDFFDAGLEPPMCPVRLLHSPPHPATADFNQLGAGAHTDWGSITMLLQDDCGGLEVRHASGEWVRAAPISGALIVNLGDMVQRWTNDIYHSTMHRVLNNLSGRDRYSAAAFFNPNSSYRVECLPTCAPADGKPLYDPCTVGEHIKQMFEQTYGNKA